MDEHPIAYHEKMLTRLEEDIGKHDTRLNALEKAAAVREEQIRNLFIAVGKMEKTAEMIQAAVEKMKEKPAKRWESIVDTVLKIVIGILLALFFAKIGVQP